jgi:hypothetical protein
MKHVLAVAMVAVFLGAGCITDEAADPEATLYGRFKADVIYDTATMNDASPWYVTAEDDDSLALTARETRLGVKFKQGDSLSGMVEWDFYGPHGATAAENKPGPLLRQMWAKMKLNDEMSVLVGQTGDVFSPLLPAMLNYGWGWNCGNPGYRRPQVRFEYAKSGIVAQIAAERGIDTEASAAADMHGRLAYTKKDDAGKTKLAIGISGMQGFADADRVGQRQATAVDLQVDMGAIVLRGEVMPWGDNLDTYLAGIEQKNVRTQAGWVQLGVKLGEKCTLNLGYMCDDPNNVEAVAADDRLRNDAKFVNLQGKLTSKATAGIELVNWNTTGSTGVLNNTRLTTTMIFTF